MVNAGFLHINLIFNAVTIIARMVWALFGLALLTQKPVTVPVAGGLRRALWTHVYLLLYAVTSKHSLVLPENSQKNTQIRFFAIGQRGSTLAHSLMFNKCFPTYSSVRFWGHCTPFPTMPLIPWQCHSTRFQICVVMIPPEEGTWWPATQLAMAERRVTQTYCFIKQRAPAPPGRLQQWG